MVGEVWYDVPMTGLWVGPKPPPDWAWASKLALMRSTCDGDLEKLRSPA